MIIIWAIWFILYISSLTTAQFGGISTYELLYGDLSNLENFFALPFNDTDDSPDSDSESEPRRRPLGELLERLENENEILDSQDGRPDVQDFNTVNIALKNLTRRARGESKRYEYDEDDYYDPGIHERKKKMMLLMINLQFLIHARYKIAMAVKLRNVVMNDKRYKLGYLFARLRRLLATQRKMVASAAENRLQWKHYSLYGLMRIYEKVARLDVDMRYTCDLIKMVYGFQANIDKLY